MGNVNRGKQFEAVIRNSFLKVPGTSVLRLPDPTNGFMGVRNICDFIVYHYPCQYFIECKCTHEGTFRFDKLTKNQRDGLIEHSSTPGIYAGVIIWFIKKDRTVFFPIDSLMMLRDAGYKSVSYNLTSVPYIDVHGRKKQILYDYDMERFFKEATYEKLLLWQDKFSGHTEIKEEH